MMPLNGVLPVDKPVGPTSHDLVMQARRQLRERRIGHTGTLDPFASGLLLLCIGASTRLAEYLTGLPKRYEATLRLGFATETDDLLGEPLAPAADWSSLDPVRIEAAFDDQRGAILQRPPRYSAKKIEGERMYDVARRGGVVEIEPVPVTIHHLSITRWALPEIDFEVECSSGTYIRAIARDLGEALGVGAHLTRLRRTAIGSFSIGDALAPDQMADPDRVRSALIPPAAAMAGFVRLEVDDSGIERILHGGRIPAPEGTPSEGIVVLLDSTGALRAIGERSGAVIQPRKVFP